VSTPVISPPTEIDATAARRRSLMLVFCCTLLGAAAQILMKTGANNLAHPGLIGMATNLPLMAGYSLYGMSTVLLVMALKDGELSLLYPVIALTYVWVTGLSFLIFHDTVNIFKLLGVAIIVAGVVVLGRGARK
jgi:multidrug transporter EmrE-like cation transporter